MALAGWSCEFHMTTKKFSLLGVVLGMIAGALIAIVSGAWMFWLALGVAIGLLLGNVNRRRKHLPNFGQGASI
jgi:ammonia channel protein AmtB